MGVPTLEVGYTSATTIGKEDHEVLKGHVVALKKAYCFYVGVTQETVFNRNLKCVYHMRYSKCYGEEKFTLEQATKAQIWSRCIALLFLQTQARWGGY
jgi:hypothetical protein